MITEARRAQLASLSEAEITNLIKVVPRLADSWAETAGIDARQLERCLPPALAALRAAMASHHDQMLASLTRIGLENILVSLDADESADDDAEGPAELAAAAGRLFGAAPGCLFLAALASGRDSLAAEVGDRMAELQECVRESAFVAEPGGPSMGEIPQPEAPGPSVRELAERTRELSALGAALARALRAAAGDVESGRPVAGVGDDLTRWSAAVSQHLSDAARVVATDDLTVLSAELGELEAQARERDARLPDALRGARLFHEQGLDHLIPGLLKAAGIDSPDDWQAVSAAGDSEAPAEAPEPEGRAEPEPQPEPQPRPETITEPQTDTEPAGPAQGSEPVSAETPWPSALPADDALQYPWDYGTPPLLASLISGQRSVLAVCVAAAADETSIRQRLLRFFSAAYSCSSAALELQLPDLSPPDTEVRQMSADECRVLLAAVLRAGLVIGYSPVDLPSLIDKADLGQAGLRTVAEAAAEAIRRGYRRETGTAVLGQADLAREWASFETGAQQYGPAGSACRPGAGPGRGPCRRRRGRGSDWGPRRHVVSRRADGRGCLQRGRQSPPDHGR